MELYANNPVNAMREKTDRFFADYENTYTYRGPLQEAMQFVMEKQLLLPELWERFVRQFREEDADGGSGWRGEYWGKMMRGACFVYGYTRDAALYDILTATVRDMITAEKEDGRISSYAQEHEFRGWDMWCRKYVLLGMQYFLEICTEETLRAEILTSMQKQADYIIAHIGREAGKTAITSTSSNWRGLNSCSILEPFVRLHALTGEARYRDFAAYIVALGGTDVANLFDLAYADELAPYQYPVTKAYEMTSCFEGLLEYYRLTGEEKYRTAVVRFADRILETDFTVIGGCGCSEELFDHSAVRQANTTNHKIMQETCVTVTLMKFLYQVHLLTGDAKYADAFERSLYNAYLGALNTEGVIEPMVKEKLPDCHIEPLPFDSYSPLTAGTRGNGIGGLCVMSDRHYYGCCACIGSAGIGLAPKMQLLVTGDGLVMNLYIAGKVTTRLPDGQAITLHTDTAYPKDGAVRITLSLPAPVAFTLRLRNPAWSRQTAVAVSGEAVPATSGYICLTRTWQDGDTVDLSLDMRTEAIYPTPYGTQVLMTGVAWGYNYVVPRFDREDPLACRHIALRRGPLLLAQENRLGYSVDDAILPQVGEDGYVAVAMPQEDRAPYPHMVEVEMPLANGGKMTLTDYASAGKLWNGTSKMAVWMLTE